MRGVLWGLTLVLVLPLPAQADDVVRCDPSDPLVPNRVIGYARSEDSVQSGARTDPQALIFASPPSDARPWNGRTPPGSFHEWTCVDANGDGSLDGVVAMTAAERTARDAPALAEALRQQALRDSLRSKLRVLGLTDDELTLLEGRR